MFCDAAVPVYKRLTHVVWFAVVILSARSLAFSQKAAKNKTATRPTISYSFMGLTAGQSQAEATGIVEGLNSTFSDLEKLQEPTCSKTLAGLSGQGLEACFFSVKYASLPAYSRSHSFVLLFVDGKLARADYEFDQNAYESMVTSIITKYGKPTESKLVKMTNGFGATMASRNYVWRSVDSQLAASEIGNTSEKSAVHVEDVQLRLEFEKRARENGPPI
jgi:hypothetical protein